MFFNIVYLLPFFTFLQTISKFLKMKQFLFALAIGTTLFVGCKGKETKAPETKMPEAVAPPPPPQPAPVAVKADTFCYEDKIAKDVFSVKLIVAGDDVTGTLDYTYYQKDGAHGTLKGKKTGDEIVAMYDASIEGSQQKEEVIFKMEADKLSRKNGPMSKKDGVMKIKDPAKAKFSEVFKKIDCNKPSAAPAKAPEKMEKKK
jgi:hypothetical protein